MPCSGCGGRRTIQPKTNTSPQTREQIRSRMPRRPEARPSEQFTGEPEPTTTKEQS